MKVGEEGVLPVPLWELGRDRMGCWARVGLNTLLPCLLVLE